MAKQRSPDGRLVYLHCSSIFSGANAQVRRAKKVSQLLEKHKASIKILTKEFTLPSIAAVAKELLEEQIFESPPRAKLRYPELFQTSEAQSAARAASEAEIIRIEDEVAEYIAQTSDDEEGDDYLEFGSHDRGAGSKRALRNKVEAPGNPDHRAIEACTKSPSHTQRVSPIPRLHPIYLPFKTQHRILVPIQALLEECCLDFGETWVPDLMETQKWHEAESIELTRWTRKFSKYAKSLPPSAIKVIAGKSINDVLFGTNRLRHTAVHRLDTSTAGILNMLNAAIHFAEALNDSKRAEKVAQIKRQLEAGIEEIVQHQNLLERKLMEQLEDITRRRAELDELEKASLEEMLAMDKKQRADIGSALERFLIASQQISNPCACNNSAIHDAMKVDSAAGNNIESMGINPIFRVALDHDQKCSNSSIKTYAHDRFTHDEEVDHQGDNVGDDDESAVRQDNCDGGVEEQLDASKPSPPTSISDENKAKRNKPADVASDSPIPEDAPVVVDEAPIPEDDSPAPVIATDELDPELSYSIPRGSSWSCEVPTQLEIAAQELTPTEEACSAAPEHVAPTEELCITEPEEVPALEDCYLAEKPPVVEDACVAEEPPMVEDACVVEEPLMVEDDCVADEAVPEDDMIKTPKYDPWATLETSKTKVTTDDVDDFKGHSLPQYNRALDDKCDLYEPAPEPDNVIQMDSEDAVAISPPASPPVRVVHSRPDPESHGTAAAASSSSSPPSTPITPVAEAPVSSNLPRTAYARIFMLTIVIPSNETIRSFVQTQGCTRTRILYEAKAHCMKRAQDDHMLATLLKDRYDCLVLESLRLDGHDVSLLTYGAEDLEPLVQAVWKTGIPEFTIRVYET